MDKDRMEGSARQAGGEIKETAGKVIGDTRLQTEGATEKPPVRSRSCWQRQRRRPRRYQVRKCDIRRRSELPGPFFI